MFYRNRIEYLNLNCRFLFGNLMKKKIEVKVWNLLEYVKNGCFGKNLLNDN